MHPNASMGIHVSDFTFLASAYESKADYKCIPMQRWVYVLPTSLS